MEISHSMGGWAEVINFCTTLRDDVHDSSLASNSEFMYSVELV